VRERGPAALVLSAGGLWAAWEVGAWEVLREQFHPGIIIGASAGAWNGWAIAGGASCDDLARQWVEPAIGRIMQFGLHRTGFLRGAPLQEAAQELFHRYRPRMPFALTVVEVPSLRSHIVRGEEVTWKHLAASCSIPFGFPPVEIDGRFFVDGGFRAGLPLWAAEQLGVRHALALNVLNTPGFRLLHRILWGSRDGSAMQVIRVEPSRRLGSLRDAVVWNPSNVERWIELGRSDASSVRM
jgi:NTE family protein